MQPAAGQLRSRTAGARTARWPQLESGQLPLDQLLGSYQRGAALLAFCRDTLQAVEDQIKVLDAGSLKAWTAE